ncbi:hypothetical protein LY44_02202 [Rhodobacter capsulatus]|nr:hypothetical protein LY44_02202 [Rhodobacter capsulatus]
MPPEAKPEHTRRLLLILWLGHRGRIDGSGQRYKTLTAAPFVKCCLSPYDDLDLGGLYTQGPRQQCLGHCNRHGLARTFIISILHHGIGTVLQLVTRSTSNPTKAYTTEKPLETRLSTLPPHYETSTARRLQLFGQLYGSRARNFQLAFKPINRGLNGIALQAPDPIEQLPGNSVVTIQPTHANDHSTFNFVIHKKTPYTSANHVRGILIACKRRPCQAL